MTARLLSAALAVALAAAALSLSSCGQKGPLVLPSKQAPPKSALQPVQTKGQSPFSVATLAPSEVRPKEGIPAVPAPFSRLLE